MKEIIDFYVPWNFQSIWICLLSVIKKAEKQSPRSMPPGFNKGIETMT